MTKTRSVSRSQDLIGVEVEDYSDSYCNCMHQDQDPNSYLAAIIQECSQTTPMWPPKLKQFKGAIGPIVTLLMIKHGIQIGLNIVIMWRHRFVSWNTKRCCEWRDQNKNLAIANRSRVSCINTNNNIMTLKSGLEVTQCH